MIIDTGPLVALNDPDDQHHDACRRALREVVLPFHTTLAVVTETMYLLASRCGAHAREGVWRLIESGHLIVHELSKSDLLSCRDFMRRYQNLPMDLADSSLMVLAGKLKAKVIFSLDSDFSVYRLHSGRPLRVIPALR